MTGHGSKNKQDILLHIGHGGTGTSFLQRSFAHTDFKSIIYDDHSGAVSKARKNGIPTGNVRKLDDLHDLVGQTKPRNKPILFSSEILFGRFGNDTDDLSKLLADGHHVKILLFIRDPLDHVITSYGQFVKRGLFLKPIEAFLQTYRSPETVALRIKKLKELGCDVTVLNYSRHTSDVKTVTETWLGETLADLTGTVVNRSLTASEIELILEAAKYLGPNVDRIGRSLCVNVTNVTPDRLMIKKNSMRKIRRTHEENDRCNQP